MQEAGMTIREDAMGNIWARWTGSDVDAGESSATVALTAAGLPGSTCICNLTSKVCRHKQLAECGQAQRSQSTRSTMLPKSGLPGFRNKAPYG